MPAGPPTEVRADAVREALEDGALLLVSTPRLAADWRRRLVAASEGVVPTPTVACWSSWLADLAQGLAELPVPYTTLQELQLWERVIMEDMGRGVAGPGLARHASEAYRLMREYRIDAGELAGGGEEAEALARWIAAMRAFTKRDGRMLAADMPALLLPHIGTLLSAPRILLDGFGVPTPMQQALLAALRDQGIRVEAAAGDTPVSPSLTACADAEAECRHVAACIAACIDADPHARLGIVTSGKSYLDVRQALEELGIDDAQAAAAIGGSGAARVVANRIQSRRAVGSCRRRTRM